MANANWPGVGQIHAMRLRITRLNQDGTPKVGASNAFVTSALTKISFKPEFEAGTEITEKNGADEICLQYKSPRKLKAGSGSLEICSPSPLLEEMLNGGTLLKNVALDVLGYKMPAVGSDPTPDGVAIEAWSRAILNGGSNPGLPYVQHVWTRAKGTPDERSLENAAQKPAFTLDYEQNTAFGAGGFDNDFTADRIYQWFLVDAIPAAGEGYVAVPA